MYVFGVLGPTLAFDLVRLLLVDMREPDVELLVHKDIVAHSLSDSLLFILR